MPGSYVQDDHVIKTPQTTSRNGPLQDEMHPSKIHQSTAKKPDSGLRLGFIDINAVKPTPTKSTIKTVDCATPSKIKPPSSPNFDFKWTRPDTVLSPEAQKIMESVREQAAKIKTKMQAEREEQARRDSEAEELFGVGGRKIANPKGKAGRYSDVHKEEFKKMDSIAGHVSAWKNRFQAGSTSLKRSKSKAGFEDFQAGVAQSAASGRLENTSPGKRMKRGPQDDTSSARPVSRDEQLGTGSKPNNASLVRSKSSIPMPSALPSAATTPTKSSLARAASIKHSQTTKIPALGRSKSFKDLASPSGSKTEGSNKYMTSLKSILHKPQHKYSNDPIKVAEGTHLPIPTSPVRLNKELPSLPATLGHALPTSPSMKRVAFTPTSKSTFELAAASPSPSKIPTSHCQRRMTGLPLSTPPGKVTYPQPVSYPALARSAGPLNSNPTKPGDFTFRSGKSINMGPATSGLSSPSTIRQVRPSGIPTTLAGVLPAFESIPAVPAVEHGLSSKKRRRADSDEEDGEKENVAAGGHAGDDVRVAKKLKRSGADDEKVTAGTSMAGKRLEKAKAAKPGEKTKGKGILSLSRLNMLARPKERR
ncbi:hypothetical protein MMC30_005815 [Trapelia coarctata]|nr:hypothetical protein [Trapelia coarctata]